MFSYTLPFMNTVLRICLLINVFPLLSYVSEMIVYLCVRARKFFIGISFWNETMHLTILALYSIFA